MALDDTSAAVVIGAGPVGLAAAAHLLERGIETRILEAAADVAASPRAWGHVRLFSPWRFNIDKAAARLLDAAGWTRPAADSLPTGDELHRHYLRPLADLPSIRRRLRLDRRVVAITRRGVDKVRTAERSAAPFVVRAMRRDGSIEDFVARAVVDASGTWQNPNPLGAAGIPALGETRAADRIHYGIPDVLGKHHTQVAKK